MPTFGNTSIGSLEDFDEPNTVAAAGNFTLAEAGRVESISLYCAALSGTTNVKCALYTADGALLGVTNAVSVDTSWAWRTFPFPTPITCPAGSYKLAWNSQSVRLLERYEIGGNKWLQYYAYNGFPDPYAPTVWHDRLISIYATYTPLAVITHNITINSSPITGIPVTMDGATIGNTPITVTVEEGSHTFAVPSEVTA